MKRFTKNNKKKSKKPKDLRKVEPNRIEPEQDLPYIGHKKDAPGWLVDNPFLLSGYRLNHNNNKLCLKSMFTWHNDTINIWSHLLASVVTFIIFIYETYYNERNKDILTATPIQFMIMAYCLTFFGSSLLHIYFCHSELINKDMLKLDYCGIAQLAATKGLTFMYYGLYCDDKLNHFYITVWLFLWGLIFVLSFTDYFHSPKMRPLKLALYVIASGLIVIPVAHILILGVQGNYDPSLPFWYLIAWLLVLFMGVLLTFVLQYPERYHPYKFDFIGASHQLWHICCISDFFITYYGTYIHYNERHKQMEC